MARGYQGQATEFNNIDGTLPDGRVRRNGALISADDANRTVIDRARNQALERQTGANPDRQIGASRAPVMADAVEPSNAMGFTDPNRYRGNNRELNVQRAKADGQFGSLQAKFNALNQGKMSMDDQGNVVPQMPAAPVTQPAPAAPQGRTPSFTPAEIAAGNGVPAGGNSIHELTYQKPDGTFYGETKAGEGRIFKTQLEASNFSRGFGAPATPSAPATAAPTSPESAPAVAGVTAKGYVAPSPEMAAMFDAASTTPEQAAARKRAMEAPTGRAAGSGFINPNGAAPAQPSPVMAAPAPVVADAPEIYTSQAGQPVPKFISNPAPSPVMAAPAEVAPSITPAPAPSMTQTLQPGQPGYDEALARVKARGDRSISGMVKKVVNRITIPSGPLEVPGSQMNSPWAGTRPSPVSAPPMPAPTPQNSIIPPASSTSVRPRQPVRPNSLSQLDATPQNDSIDFPRFSSSGSRRPTARLA